MKLHGTVWKFGDNVDTDLIIPARFLNSFDKDDLAQNCFVDVRPGFMDLISPGDIIVAGKNFGTGSSREHAPLAIKAAGISVIIAESFARIFYRNAINIGLPILECPAAVEGSEAGQTLEVELETGRIHNLDTEQIFRAEPYPEFMMGIIRAGGLIEYTRVGG